MLWHTFLQILGTILPVSTGHTSYRGLFFISWVESKKPGQSSILVRDKKNCYGIPFSKLFDCQSVTCNICPSRGQCGTRNSVRPWATAHLSEPALRAGVTLTGCHAVELAGRRARPGGWSGMALASVGCRGSGGGPESFSRPATKLSLPHSINFN